MECKVFHVDTANGVSGNTSFQEILDILKGMQATHISRERIEDPPTKSYTRIRVLGKQGGKPYLVVLDEKIRFMHRSFLIPFDYEAMLEIRICPINEKEYDRMAGEMRGLEEETSVYDIVSRRVGLFEKLFYNLS